MPDIVTDPMQHCLHCRMHALTSGLGQHRNGSLFSELLVHVYLSDNNNIFCGRGANIKTGDTD